jgi:hypothetical protein
MTDKDDMGYQIETVDWERVLQDEWKREWRESAYSFFDCWCAKNGTITFQSDGDRNAACIAFRKIACSRAMLLDERSPLFGFDLKHDREYMIPAIRFAIDGIPVTVEIPEAYWKSVVNLAKDWLRQKEVKDDQRWNRRRRPTIQEPQSDPAFDGEGDPSESSRRTSHGAKLYPSRVYERLQAQKTLTIAETWTWKRLPPNASVNGCQLLLTYCREETWQKVADVYGVTLRQVQTQVAALRRFIKDQLAVEDHRVADDLCEKLVSSHNEATRYLRRMRQRHGVGMPCPIKLDTEPPEHRGNGFMPWEAHARFANRHPDLAKRSVSGKRHHPRAKRTYGGDGYANLLKLIFDRTRR